MEKEIIPNLRTTYDKHQEDIGIYNYYKNINEEEGHYKIIREEYYKFLINLLKDINSSLKMPYKGGNTWEEINICRTFSTNHFGVITCVDKFLTSNKIGRLFSVVKSPTDNNQINYLIVIKCNFEEFFEAIYGEIQFMEYYEEDNKRKNR